MIEFYQLDDATNEYDHAGTIEDGEVTEGDLDWVLDFVEGTGDLSIDDEEVVIFRVSNEYLVGVIPDDDAELADASDRSLIDDTTPDFDAHYLRLLEGHAWHPDTDRKLWAETEVPDMVEERVREAIMEDAIFSDFDGIPSDKLMQMRLFMVEQLEQDGWTTEMVAGRLQDLEPSLSDAEAERIARTETASVVNTAREEAYEDRGLADDQFKWVGTQDDRTTQVCEWLKGGDDLAGGGPSFEGTNPEYGGSPVTIPRLKELIQDANDAFIDHDARTFVPHIQCRHTYVRHVE